MRGVVEVYNNYGLIESGSNTIVDGFSESLVDILTFIATTSFSGLYNVSNFGIAAISYSKSASGFAHNCHVNSGIQLSGKTFNPPSLFLQNLSQVSSIRPVERVPSYSDPRDRVLELLPSSVSALIRTYGQNINAIAYSGTNTTLSSLPVSSILSLGCYPASATGDNRIIAALYNNASSLITSSRFGGYTTGSGFNGSPSSMDWRGFQRTASAAALGVLVSSTLSVLSSTGTLLVRFYIDPQDLAVVGMYGGIQSIGLWTIDLVETLKVVSHPFTWNPANNAIKYKLIAKKVLANNLCYNEDNGSNAGLNSYTGITGNWYIYMV
jgi:hypothetical protein